jgi:hypothetical protein
MAENRALAAAENRGHPPSLVGQSPPADGEYAPVERVQEAPDHQPLDRPGPNPALPQLRSGHHPVLLVSQPDDRPLPRPSRQFALPWRDK